jgi:carbon monoxide dehydrogenase subunit G
VVAYAQSAKETGYGHFKGVLDASFKNPCGMKTKSGGANNDPNAHQRFSTWEEGIQAQIDHLALYAGAPGYPKAETPDPRHFPYLKGTAPNVEDLGGKWAPSANYGKDIVAMMAKLEATAAPAAPAPQPQPGVMYYVQTGAYSVKANADTQYYKVKAAGFDAIIKKSGNLYRVQVGAFSVRANAEAFAAKVKAAGFDTYITTTGGTQVAPGPAPKATETKTIKVGSKVKVKKGAKTYTGGSLASFVYNTVYDVLQINDNRVVIGLKGQVTAAVRLEDLILQ